MLAKNGVEGQACTESKPEAEIPGDDGRDGRSLGGDRAGDLLRGLAERAKELPPEANISSEESWRLALPGDFRGATRVEQLWHLYYGEKPPCVPGDTLELV